MISDHIENEGRVGGLELNGRGVIKETPLVLETPFEALQQQVTPLTQHFVRDHFERPQLGGDHSFTVHGPGVNRPLEVSMDALKDLPQREVAITFECAGNNRTSWNPVPAGAPWEKGGVSTALYRGVPLQHVLDQAGLDERTALEVAATGADKGSVPSREDDVAFARAIPIELAKNPDVILALEMDGVPLPPEHGGPVRLIVPGRYGVDNVKWVESLEVLSTKFQGHFQVDDYVMIDDGPKREIGPMRVKSITTEPGAAPVPISGGKVGGWAWSGRGTVERVVYSLDSKPWEEARLTHGLGEHAWSRWEVDLQTLSPGRHVIRSRATDSSGESQPEQADWNELGYVNNGVTAYVFQVE